MLLGEEEARKWCGGGEVRGRGVLPPAENARQSYCCRCRPRRSRFYGPPSSATTWIVESLYCRR